jgi:hypothetical protein
LLKLIQVSVGEPVWQVPPVTADIREIEQGMTGHLSSSTLVCPVYGVVNPFVMKDSVFAGAVTLTSGKGVVFCCASAPAQQIVAASAIAALQKHGLT